MNRFVKISTFILIGFGLMWGVRNWAPKNATSMYRIGIVQVIDHPALDQTRLGILDGLEKAGLTQDVCHVSFESAQGNPALAAQIVQKFVGQKVSLIVALGTTPAQAAAQITQNTGIPVVFSSVTDPIGAKLVLNLEKPEGNITGVSNFVPIEDQFSLFKKLLPHLKTLGVIYNPGEANSASLMEKMQAVAETTGLVLVPSVASKTSDVIAAAKNLMGRVNAVFVNNDNTALAAFDAIAKVSLENKTPAFVSDMDLLNHGALAALGPDQYELGHQTAQMIIKILQDKIAVAMLPVEKPKNTHTKINQEIAKALEISGIIVNLKD
jgi:putative ABC transport system substrate-binding protein